MSERLERYLEKIELRKEGQRITLDLPAAYNFQNSIVELNENGDIGEFEKHIILLHFKRIIEVLDIGTSVEEDDIVLQIQAMVYQRLL